MKIEYGNGSNLIFLQHSLMHAEICRGREAKKPPKLNRLGGQEWNKTKTQVHQCGKKYCTGSGEALCRATGVRRLSVWTGYDLAERI